METIPYLLKVKEFSTPLTNFYKLSPFSLNNKLETMSCQALFTKMFEQASLGGKGML